MCIHVLEALGFAYLICGLIILLVAIDKAHTTALDVQQHILAQTNRLVPYWVIELLICVLVVFTWPFGSHKN
jgi:hypothetical protein